MGSSKQTTTQSVPQYYEDFMRQQLFPKAQEIANMDFQAYGGQRVAGVAPQAAQAQGLFERIGGIANMTPQDFAAMNQANMNPFQSQVIDAALARSARDRDIARTGEMAQITGANAFGNERRGVFEGERQAAYDIGRDQLVANLMQQGYGNAQAQTMAQLQQQQGAAGQAAGGLMQIGGQQQATEQAALDAAFQEFMREQNMPLQQLGALTAASSGAQIPMSQTQSYKPGLFDYIQAGSQAASAFAMSDIRLKTDIEKVSERDGISFYNWSWTPQAIALGADPSMTSGVIADELEDIHPDLVRVDQDGFKRVDYVGLQERLG